MARPSLPKQYPRVTQALQGGAVYVNVRILQLLQAMWTSTATSNLKNGHKKRKKEEKRGPTQQLCDWRLRGKTGQSSAERMKEPQGEGRSLWGLWGRQCEFDKGHDEIPKTNPLQKCKLIRLVDTLSTSVVIHTCPRAESPLTRSSAYWGWTGSKILICRINQCFAYFYNTSFFKIQKKKDGGGCSHWSTKIIPTYWHAFE